MKKFIAAILMAVVAVHAPLNIALASQNLEPVKTGVQQSYYDYLIAPVAALVVGFQQDGKRGALIGLAAGCVDEALVRTGWAERHYLTAGVLGMGATSSIKWAWAPYLGFAGGSLIATGKLNPIIEKAGLPVSTAIVGAAQGGATGAAIGAACGIVDQGLIWLNVTAKPYFSNVVNGLAISSAVAPHLGAIATSSLPLKQIVGLGIAGMMSTGKPMYAAKSPLELKDDLHGVLSRVSEPKALNELMEKQAIVLVASQLTLANLGLTLSRHFQNMDMSFAGLGSATESGQLMNAQAGFNKALVGLVLFFPVNFAVQSASGFINSLLSERTSRQVRDAVFHKFSDGEVALRLSSDPNATVLVEKMGEYLGLVLGGSNALGSALGSATDAVFYVSFLHRANALDLIVILDVYIRAISLLNVGLASWISSYEQSLREANSREYNLARDILKEPYLLIPGGKMDLVKGKMLAARKEYREITDKVQGLNSLQSSYSVMSHVLSYIAKNYLVASKIVEGKLPFKDAQPALQAVASVSNAMSWQSTNAQTIQGIGVAVNNMHLILDKFEETKAPELVANYKTGASDTVGIRFENVTVGVEDTTLIHVPELFLDSGVYAVTGAQGSGKSAFLSKVKGIKENQFWAKGDITYLTPDGMLPSTMLVTQKDYLAPYSTLLELIMLKPTNQLDVEAIKPRVMALLQEIGFDSGGDEAKVEKWLMEEQAEWSKLSGGQRKTVAIVGAIMTKPELLILDEVFAGMDKQALANAQRAIKRELPGSLIFVVDHHAHDNNVDGFYDKELHFADRELYVKDIAESLVY